ncbi:uncharacterized protein LOC125208870 isoform X4 [Salvia hispanica]|uniref:uncharacterized protein LOC125208870 isoform X4 n=1 Tax=Salvia hispanica TaxID=49212 RepID=UPI0020090CC2|nr:uncharacterized protein LOC125208870 isoform X4 [Salvia hispanica]
MTAAPFASMTSTFHPRLAVDTGFVSSMLIQPGEEVGKIVRDIQLYNNTNLGGFSGLLMKAAGLPLLIRRGLWENLNITMLEYLCNSMHKIGVSSYNYCDFIHMMNFDRMLVRSCCWASYMKFLSCNSSQMGGLGSRYGSICASMAWWCSFYGILYGRDGWWSSDDCFDNTC